MRAILKSHSLNSDFPFFFFPATNDLKLNGNIIMSVQTNEMRILSKYLS